MIETMNERREHFVSEMREFSLLPETNPSLPIPRLKSSLYDDCESFLPLESNVFDDAPSTNLEEVFNPPLTSLPYVAPFFSSTPVATSVSNLTSLASLLCLGLKGAPYTALEMCETSRGDVSVPKDASLLRLKELALVGHILRRLPLRSFMVIW